MSEECAAYSRSDSNQGDEMSLIRGSASSAVVLLAALLTVTRASADVTPYEWVTESGPNNVIDSNPESCDFTAFNFGNGSWASAGQGCYGRDGRLCSTNPGGICDLQVVPKG